MPHCSKNIIVTGATGFVGRRVVAALLTSDLHVNIYALVRKSFFFDRAVKEIIIEDINDISWLENFPEEIDCVIHIAGAAHNKTDQTDLSPLDYFRQVNTFATKKIAHKAALKGARRFILISSIGVLGTTTENEPFTDETPESPISDYAISKYEAELEVKKICRDSQFTMDFVIIRPPLVYGHGAPGNFSKLLKITKLGIPLPFLLVKNRRSFIDCNNLADFITCCIYNTNASDQTFVISDDDSISTPDLIKHLSIDLRSGTTLFPVPVFLLRVAFTLFGKKSLYEQLCCSLEIDSSKARKLLQWSAPNKLSESLTDIAVNSRVSDKIS